jgi:acyl-ACP thioesterase
MDIADQTWKENFEIKSYCIDFQQKLKPSSLMEFFQEAASNHAQHLGAGYETLANKELYWVLSRVRAEIIRMPQWGESITVETWPAGIEGLQFRRDFLVFDRDQQVIIRAVTGWLLVNGQNLRPQRMAALGFVLSPVEGKKALDNFPERLNVNTSNVCYRKKILYNEIDQNLHVNNTRYFELAADCFDIEHYQQNHLSAFTAEFLSELHWGDEIETRVGEIGGISEVEVINRTKDNTVFKAKLEWS